MRRRAMIMAAWPRCVMLELGPMMCLMANRSAVVWPVVKVRK